MNSSMTLPEGADRWNKALLGAFKKGMAAAKGGKDITDCPYKDKRKGDGRLTWSRSFIIAWKDGFRWYHDVN